MFFSNTTDCLGIPTRAKVSISNRVHFNIVYLPLYSVTGCGHNLINDLRRRQQVGLVDKYQTMHNLIQVVENPARFSGMLPHDNLAAGP